MINLCITITSSFGFDFCEKLKRTFFTIKVADDSFPITQVCRACGLLGYYNHKLKTGICSSCKNGEQISTMKLPYACKLLIQVMMC